MRINVKGVEIYYKVSGEGSPIILLHGNSQDHTIFRVLRKMLSKSYTVYAIDSRDHGRSSRVDDLDYMSKMEDVAELIRVLEVHKPIVYGFSDGGIIGLLLAIYHPELLSKLIISGANINPDGVKRYAVVFMKVLYFFTRNRKIKLMLTQPDILEEELYKITTPTLVLAGHRDVIKESHTKLIARSIPGSELRILPGESHTSYVLHNEKLYGIIKSFLG